MKRITRLVLTSVFCALCFVMAQNGLAEDLSKMQENDILVDTAE